MKEKSLFRKWLDIQHERAMTHKALRLLTKQEWSVDFLTALLVRASHVKNQSLEMTICSSNGAQIKVSTATIDKPLYNDDSIFNHLDDELRVQEFINSVGRK